MNAAHLHPIHRSAPTDSSIAVGAPQPAREGDRLVTDDPAMDRPRPTLPGEFFSCRCAKIRNAAASRATCPDCGQPLNLKWNGDPRAASCYDPNIHIDILTDQACDLLRRMRTIVDEFRPYVRLDEIAECLARIDGVRIISLHGLSFEPARQRRAKTDPVQIELETT